MPRHPSNGICRQRDGEWFAVMRPSGRISRRAFRSPLRAAEYVMHVAGVDWWPTLAARGVSIVPVTIAQAEGRSLCS